MTTKDDVPEEDLRALSTRALVYLKRQGFGTDDALDICQESMLKYVSVQESFKAKKKPLPDATRFFLQIVRTKAVDALRRRQSLSSIELESEAGSVGEVEKAGEADMIRAALDEFH